MSFPLHRSRVTDYIFSNVTQSSSAHRGFFVNFSLRKAHRMVEILQFQQRCQVKFTTM
ncbi:hypothetical protein BN2497_12267 [Janthinobacterium sp. CG23_2]|nr:hypothetical protein BN2497_12267 [Janthinobacterium sp. CG23_2]CUU32531.1 hypothetical protein BN3177_12267 [Janthinobacterium sp. CG23_2]